jgi:hypothetical protein
MRVSEVFAMGGGCGCDHDGKYHCYGYYDAYKGDCYMPDDGRYSYTYYNGYNYGGYTYYGHDRRLGKL